MGIRHRVGVETIYRVDIGYIGEIGHRCEYNTDSESYAESNRIHMGNRV